jgi:ferredoxin
MLEAEVKFEREDREGLVAVGTYLIDSAKRFGVNFEGQCVLETNTHYCAVNIRSGSDLLSGLTQRETEYFDEVGREPNERLACQVRIEKPGEITIMTKKKVEETEPEAESGADASEKYKKEFAEMPLEKKIANLVQLESIALSETVSFIVNSPFAIADKLMDVMAEFGFKKEERQKEAARPAEHKNGGDRSNGKERSTDTSATKNAAKTSAPDKSTDTSAPESSTESVSPESL